MNPIRSYFSRSKVFLISGLLLLYFSILFGRLYYLQVVLYDSFLKKSQENFLRYETNAPLRGNIVDCKGTLLATNKPQTHVCWKGTGKRKLTEEQHRKLEIIASICQQPFIASEEAILIAEKKQRTTRLMSNLSFSMLTLIVEQFPNDPNICIETDSTRYYPYNSLASHTLGYLGILNVSPEGRMGLEKWCQQALQGEKGRVQRSLNSFGKIIDQEEIEPSIQGQTIQMTVDLELQKIAEESFPQEYKGAFILLESDTGKIRALLSRPSFDPNIFTTHMDHETWQKIQEQRPFLNRIFNATYPPGSIFKIVTMTTALEKKIIPQDTECFCKGYVTFGKRKIYCSRKTGHGKISASESMAHSCNTLFFLLGKHLDIDLLAHYAHEYGLGVSLNPQFNDAPGLIPTRTWKKQTKGESWWQGETLSATIGQSFLLVTPLQVAQLMASIQTGYLTQPHILEHQEYEKRPLSISKSTREFFPEALTETIYHGTARGLQRFKRFKMYAKTSTAQTSSLEKKESGESKYFEHRWLAINFQFEDEPWMTLVMIVENAEEKKACTLIAQRFFKEYQKLKGKS